MNNSIRVYSQKELDVINDFNQIQNHIFSDEIQDVFSYFNYQRHNKVNQRSRTPILFRTIRNSKINYKILLIEWTPTFAKCGFASQIGLSIRWKLNDEMPDIHQYKIFIKLKQYTHDDEKKINQQLNDKERVQAAFENKQLKQNISKLF